MKLALKAGPVELVGRPEFKPGFIHGLALPACVVRLEFAANIEPVLAGFEDILHTHLGKPDIPAEEGGCPFTRTAKKFAYWCLEFQNRCGLVVQSTFWTGNLVFRKEGFASLSLVLPYRFADPTTVALALVINLINGLAANRKALIDIDSLIATSRKLISKFRELGQNVPDLLKAAIAKGIPFQRIEGQLYRFGIGGAQRFLESTFTDRTAVIGTK